MRMNTKKGGGMNEKKERFLCLDDVINKTGMKRTSIYNKMKSGEFPKSIHISANRIAWLESEIDSWMTTKIKNRNQN